MKPTNKIITNYQKKKVLVKVSLPNQNVYGYVISILDEGFIVAQFLDFHFEGYMYIATNNIVGISDKGQKIYQDTLENKVKVVKKSIFTHYDACNTFKHLYEKILTKLCIIELVGSPDWLFGGLLSQKDNHIIIREFAATGKWYKSKNKIELENIAFIQRDTEYLNVYDKYIVEKNR